MKVCTDGRQRRMEQARDYAYCIQMPLSYKALQRYDKHSSKEVSLLNRQQVRSSAERKHFTSETSDRSRDTCMTLLA